MTNKKITQEFIEYIVGTCYSIAEAFSTLDIEDEELIDWELVDEQIFRCDDCSWWCDVGDMREDEVCGDCTRMTHCSECYLDSHEDDLHAEGLCDTCYEEANIENS